jgi:hypothetical protein
VWFSFFAVAVSVCLGGTEARIISGNATASENRKDVAHVILARNQLSALSRWLEQRQRAWGAHITEPSTEPVAISIELTRADGKINHIDVVTAARGGHYMRLSIGPGIEWAYRSFGGIVKTRYAQQSINDADFAKLDQLLFHPASP